MTASRTGRSRKNTRLASSSSSEPAAHWNSSTASSGRGSMINLHSREMTKYMMKFVRNEAIQKENTSSRRRSMPILKQRYMFAFARKTIKYSAANIT